MVAMQCGVAQDLNDSTSEHTASPIEQSSRPECTLPPAYNGSAQIKGKYDVFGSVSFLYWYVAQDGMDLAIPTGAVANPLPPPSLLTVNPSSQGSQFIFQDFSYNPGFKIVMGAGLRNDGWVGQLEYTWMSQTTTTNLGTPPSYPRANTTSIWTVSNWFSSYLPAASSVESTWKMSFNQLDVTSSRSFYQGKKVTVTPFGGLRALWMNQSMNVNATLFNASINPATSHTYSHSWSLGLVGGCYSNWMLPFDFRLQGDVNGSLLYTNYTSVVHNDTLTFLASTPTQLPSSFSYEDFGALRPTWKMGLGFGWERYFQNKAYHCDLTASYDFMIFWNQNMIRALMDNFLTGTGSPQNLYLHGMTLTGRFDF